MIMEKSSAETQIPGVNIDNFVFMNLDTETGLSKLVIDENQHQDMEVTLNISDTTNASDNTNTVGDYMDIVGDDDVDIPCSQIKHTNLYVKLGISEAVPPVVQEAVMAAMGQNPDTVPDAVDTTCEQR